MQTDRVPPSAEDLAFAADYAALANLEARYARTWDSADHDGWADVFTADGVFEIAAVGDRAAQRYEGRPALAAFCKGFNAQFIGFHLPALPYVELVKTAADNAGCDNATGHVNFHFVAIGRLASAHTMTRSASGHYEVRYRRTAQGWRIVHRLERAFASARHEVFEY